MECGLVAEHFTDIPVKSRRTGIPYDSMIAESAGMAPRAQQGLDPARALQEKFIPDRASS